MKYLILGLLFSSSVIAKDVSCLAKKNLSEVWHKKTEVMLGAKVLFGSIDQFKFYVKNIDDSRFELEVLDENTPSRQYASGDGKEINWTLWSRKALIDFNCEH
ncbi:MAG: hypothetical protein CME70_22630 [Halobacteriovorax sp.]|nr:hypothetical protein [Halobacteriovorax sp.]|tara:strand:- start:49617 stop:49925 length:309 start_codon:yes stop_codon:yes gene_type:complete